MAKYVYPAIFTPEDDGGFSVRFPDVESCYTGSETLTGAMEMANDVLCMMLYEMEEHKREIPAPSSVPEIQKQAEDGEFVSLISCDTIEYRRFHDSKAVKKTFVSCAINSTAALPPVASEKAYCFIFLYSWVSVIS